MSEGRSGYGATITGSVSGAIGYLRGISVGGSDVTDIDVSSGDSTSKAREFMPGMIDAGEITLSMVYQEDVADDLLDLIGGTAETWTIAFGDGSSFACSGYFKSMSIDAPFDGEATATGTIKLTGEPTFTVV